MILQVISTLFSIVIVLACARELGKMMYPFGYIFMRYIRHNDNEPLDWLLANKKFIAFYCLAISQLMTINGLLRQMQNGNLESKELEFFVSAPITKLCILWFVHEFAKENYVSYKQKYELLVVRLNKLFTLR